MSLLEILEEVALNVDSLATLANLRRVSKKFQEKLSSPEFSSFVYYRFFGENKPRSVWNSNREEVSWSLEFSYLRKWQSKFFFHWKGRYYFHSYGAYINSLRRKDRVLVRFFERKLGYSCDEEERLFYIHTRIGEVLTKEQVDFISENLASPSTIMDYTLLNYNYNMADYPEGIEVRDIHKRNYIYCRIKYAQRGFYDLWKRNPSFHPSTIYPVRYHPDQEKIPCIPKDYLTILRAGTFEERYKAMKSLWPSNTYPIKKYVELGSDPWIEHLREKREFSLWLIKTYPEDAKQWLVEEPAYAYLLDTLKHMWWNRDMSNLLYETEEQRKEIDKLSRDNKRVYGNSLNSLVLQRDYTRFLENLREAEDDVLGAIREYLLLFKEGDIGYYKELDIFYRMILEL